MNKQLFVLLKKILCSWTFVFHLPVIQTLAFHLKLACKLKGVNNLAKAA